MPVPPVLRIGTRRSELARWQAAHVAEALSSGVSGAPPVTFELIETEGDRILGAPLATVPGEAFFTKEIEDALLSGKVSLAVHSMKDLPTTLPRGLVVGAVLRREDPHDVLVSMEGATLAELPAGSRVGTSSVRRRAFILHARPDLRVEELRGNVPTRIHRLEEGRYDAIVLARAGMLRLGLLDGRAARLDVDRFPPAVAQGALAVEIREGDEETARWVAPLDHAESRAAVTAERALLRALGAGCQAPVGALAVVDGDTLTIEATVCAADGREALVDSAKGSVDEAEGLGMALAEALEARGADRLVAEARAAIRKPGA
jgi:hydroxymethylbilane synthase